ncbi:SAP domain containing protein [Acanthamoeba castellanii str. Neff]|uniref:SAP domain containing protein n=1 Tax=Acanthamoeba castellanii (strain ATCC 30010 / Neff) TaxID=1257118 RepID=L8GV34_ACACF|nr:SAP domain containing protein [Acanthamoeba castellanii str. Neff]ELR16797.1 SAP domain containing protein [Acanthamoeba castellanii str. Neff]
MSRLAARTAHNKNNNKKESSLADSKPALEKGVSVEEVFKWYIVTELRDFLRKNGLPVSGRKADLVERVVGHLHSGSRGSSSSNDESSEDEEKSESESESEGEESNDEDEASEGDEDEEEEDRGDAYVEKVGFERTLQQIAKAAGFEPEPLLMLDISQFETKLQARLGSYARLPDELWQLYRFSNGFCWGEKDLQVFPLAVSCREDIFGADEEDTDLRRDYSPYHHPAWIPFACRGEYDHFLINVNAESESYGQVKSWSDMDAYAKFVAPSVQSLLTRLLKGAPQRRRKGRRRR